MWTSRLLTEAQNDPSNQAKVQLINFFTNARLEVNDLRVMVSRVDLALQHRWSIPMYQCLTACQCSNHSTNSNNSDMQNDSTRSSDERLTVYTSR